MKPFRKCLAVWLVLTCSACTQEPKFESNPGTQGVGFSSTTGNSTFDAGAAQYAPSDDSGETAAAIIAVLGLVALILLADSVQACSGSGC